MEDGYINRNNQMCCGHSGNPGNHGNRGSGGGNGNGYGGGHSGNPGNHGNQLAYSMKCLVAGCGFVYGANGCDVWLVKCGRCQGGRPGSVRERAST